MNLDQGRTYADRVSANLKSFEILLFMDKL